MSSRGAVAAPSLRTFGALWWAVSLIGLLLAIALAAFSGLALPAACNAGEGLLADLGTSPEELGICEARAGWQRAVSTALPLLAAIGFVLALGIVVMSIARGAERRGKVSFAIGSGSRATVARLLLVCAWLMLTGWFVAQALIGLIGSYNSA